MKNYFFEFVWMQTCGKKKNIGCQFTWRIHTHSIRLSLSSRGHVHIGSDIQFEWQFFNAIKSINFFNQATSI